MPEGLLGLAPAQQHKAPSFGYSDPASHEVLESFTELGGLYLGADLRGTGKALHPLTHLHPSFYTASFIAQQ